MLYIYQIGRLDTRNQQLRFRIDGKDFECQLSSMALKKHFENNGKMILIYPVSLPFNRNLIEKSDLDEDFKSKIKEVFENKESYFQVPFEFFKSHPHTKYADDFLLIHSLGEYEGEVFDGKFDDIVLEILIDLVERHFTKPMTELYVDISSGHNIYISAMLESIRHFSIFHKLSSWDLNNLSIKIAFSDPIIGSSKQTFDIHKDYELKYKSFFSSPITKEDLENFNLSRKIAGDNREFKRKIQSMLEKFSLLYSAVKNNTPLVAYSYEFHSEEEIKAFIIEIIKHLKDKLFKDWKKSPALEKNEYLKVLLTLSFYTGIVRVMAKYHISKKAEVSIEELKENFEKIYRCFGLDLNREILGHEISCLLKKDRIDGLNLLDRVSNNWQSLSEFIAGEGDFQKRNFIAHAGFERTVTEVRKHNNSLYLRYKEDRKLTIQNALKESF